MKCVKCSQLFPDALRACPACGWPVKSHEATALAPIRSFICAHCHEPFSYRSAEAPRPGRLCWHCRGVPLHGKTPVPGWYDDHADTPPDPWVKVGVFPTPLDDPIAEPDYFPRLIFEYAQTHGILVTEAAVLLAPDWLARHPDDPECARVRLYLENIGRAREKNA